MQLYLGIDGGGTTTRAIVIDGDLNVLGRGKSGSSNHYSVGLKRTAENIGQAVSAALQGANAAANDVVSWGMGLAGACTEAEKTELRNALSPLCPSATLTIDEDVAAAQAGAFAGDAGAVCIAGTGANCFGINAAGKRARADGRGPLLGDRGSGYWIGEQALRTACKMDDGVAEKSSLLDTVLSQLDVPDVPRLVQLVYQPTFERDRIAALVPAIMDLAKQGDNAATDILQAAGSELAATTAVVLRELGLSQVAPVGGVLSQQTILRETYAAELMDVIPGIEIIDVKYDAIIGAALMAMPK